MDFVNKNDKQLYFNKIKGTIAELNSGDVYCSITLKVGHENTRLVNFTIKKAEFLELTKSKQIGDKITILFFLTSKHKNGRWYTMANVLDVLTED